MSRRTEKIKDELVQRYRLVRALQVCYYTSGAPIAQFSSEFFFAVGSVLENGNVDYSKLRLVTQEKVEQFLKEDK